MASARSLPIFYRLCGKLEFVCRRPISSRQLQVASHTTLRRKRAKLPLFRGARECFEKLFPLLRCLHPNQGYSAES